VSLDQAAQSKLAGAGIVARKWAEGKFEVFRLVAAYNVPEELMSRFEEALS